MSSPLGNYLQTTVPRSMKPWGLPCCNCIISPEEIEAILEESNAQIFITKKFKVIPFDTRKAKGIKKEERETFKRLREIIARTLDKIKDINEQTQILEQLETKSIYNEYVDPTKPIYYSDIQLIKAIFKQNYYSAEI